MRQARENLEKAEREDAVEAQEEAKQLLENTTMPVEEISEQAGYSDASFFRRLFKRLTGLTPAHYRKMFRPVLAPE